VAPVLAAANFGESYVLEIVGLVLAVLVVVRWVVPPLRRAMSAQLESVRSQLAAGDEAREATARLVAQRRTELARAQADAAVLVEQARQSAEQVLTDGKRRGEEEHERLVARAGVEAALARSRAREAVTRQIAALVVEAAELVIEAELDDTIHHHLIAEAIEAAEAEAV